MARPTEDKPSHLHDGLMTMLVVAAFMTAAFLFAGACAGVGLVYRWNHAVGATTGVIAILVFFFIVGATADWDDDGGW